MSLTDTTSFPGGLDIFPDVAAGSGDVLNTLGKEHDALHDKTSKAVKELERILVGPTHYNVEGFPQATFTERWAAALTLAEAAGGGKLVLPPKPTYSSAALQTITKPTIDVEGPGGAAGTIITHTGASPALLKVQPSPTTVVQQGTIKGIKLVGSAVASTIGLHCIDTGVLPRLEDFVVNGFNAASSIGIKLQNIALWNERASGIRVALENNAIGLQMVGSGAFNSFFYPRWLDLRLNISAGQIGIQTAGTALLQGGRFGILVNIDGTGGIVWDVAGTSTVGGEVSCSGEQTSGTGGINRRIGATGIWAATGSFNVDGTTQTIIAGGSFWPIYEITPGGAVLASFPDPAIVAAGAAAGTAPPAATIAGNDTRGLLGAGTGTATTTGVLWNVTFKKPYPAAPVVVFTPNPALAELRPSVDPTTVTASGFTVSVGVAPAVSQAAGTYGGSFHVIG